MRYLCLGYHDRKLWDGLGEPERQKLLNEMAAYERMLQQAGHAIESAVFEGTGTSATLRLGSGGVSVTDTSAADNNERLEGVMLLDARDLNHAIQLLSQFPSIRLGGRVEIRTINEMSSERRVSHEIHAADLHD